MMNKKNSIALAGLLLSLLLFSVCKARKITTQAVASEEKSAFYTFDATRDTIQHLTVFTLKSITIANAKIKYSVDEAKAKEPSYLRIQISGKSNKIVEAVVEHPLFKRMEVFSESGQIEPNLISLPHTEFTLRVPYFEDYKKIRITEVVNFKASPPVILKNEK